MSCEFEYANTVRVRDGHPGVVIDIPVPGDRRNDIGVIIKRAVRKSSTGLLASICAVEAVQLNFRLALVRLHVVGLRSDTVFSPPNSKNPKHAETLAQLAPAIWDEALDIDGPSCNLSWLAVVLGAAASAPSRRYI